MKASRHPVDSWALADGVSVQILAILYDGGEAARQETRLLGAVENKVGTNLPMSLTTFSSSRGDRSLVLNRG